ncbi:MAG: DUF3306 domain-containing protein [Salinarimonas sp.]
MSGGFLGRWSQRKLSEKEKNEAQARAPDSPDRADEEPESHELPDRDIASHEAAQEISAAPQQEEILSEEELAALPPIDSITSQTDLRQFLRKGVPSAVKNAAMRKMWLLDPAIRNHVDYAVDYAWDWNVPGGVPGHGGQIAGESVAKMLDKLLPKPVSDENQAAPELSGHAADAPDPEYVENQRQTGVQPEGEAADSDDVASAEQPKGDDSDPELRKVQPAEHIEAQAQSVDHGANGDSVSRSDEDERLRPRRHGGALPI